MTIPDWLWIDGQRVDANVIGRMTTLTRVGTMEGAASLEIGLDDQDLEILTSGLLARPGKPNRRQATIANFDQAAWARFGASRLTFQGWFTRLAGAEFSYGTGRSLTLTFEDEIAAMMRRSTAALKTSRGQMTRAEFIHWLARRAMIDHGRQFGFYSPQEGQRQKIKQPTDPVRNKGIHNAARLTVKGTEMNEAQRRTAEAVLAEADRLRAGELATLAMIVANIGEAEYDRHAVNPSSHAKGLFQILPSYWDIVDPMDLKQGADYFLNVGFTHLSRAGHGQVAGPPTPVRGAIQIAAEDSTKTPGEIASEVEGSDQQGPFYDQYVDEAKAILAAWGGAGTQVTIRERFEFRAGGRRKGEAKARNYFDDAGDLAQQVRWRLFAAENVLWFVSDEWLFSRKPTFVLDRGALTPGVLEISGHADIGVPISEVTIKAKAPAWTVKPGAVVQIDDLGPLNGRWLIWQHRDDVLREQTEITLHRPAPALAEPAPTVKVKSVGGIGDTGGDLAYPLGKRGTFIQGPYGTGTHHAGQNWQSSNAIDIGVPTGTAVYAVDDGVISPTGTPYSGFGDTHEGGRFAGQRLHLVSSGNAWWYGHLSQITVKQGDHVSKGDPIGLSGAANGVAHLHIACEHGNPRVLLGWKNAT